MCILDVGGADLLAAAPVENFYKRCLTLSPPKCLKVSEKVAGQIPKGSENLLCVC